VIVRKDLLVDLIVFSLSQKVFDSLMYGVNKLDIHHEPFGIHIKPCFHWKDLKCSSKAFYTDQTFRDL
jgi:hypothetical protein